MVAKGSLKDYNLSDMEQIQVVEALFKMLKQGKNERTTEYLRTHKNGESKNHKRGFET